MERIFLGSLFTFSLTVVVPLTGSGGWRGIGDVIAVGFYLLGVIPLGGIALLELGVIGKSKTDQGKMALHASFVGIVFNRCPYCHDFWNA